MGSAKPKSEGFFLKANIYRALYQQDKELLNSYIYFIITSNLNYLLIEATPTYQNLSFQKYGMNRNC